MKSKKEITILVLVVVFAIAVSFVAKKLKKTNSPLLSGGNQDKESQKEYITIATSIYDALSVEYVGSYEFQDAMDKILSLSENDLVGVHNAYLKKYKSSDYPSMKQLVTSCWTWYPSSRELRDKALQKLSTIGA